MMKKNIIITIIICIGLTTKYSGQVGVGTDTPNNSAILDVFSTNKGFLPPRMALTNINDVATIPSPATGLLVYNTAVNGSAPYNVFPGLYVNLGTPASPIWSIVQISNNSQGSVQDKLRYLGPADATKSIIVDNFLEFRLSQSGTTYLFQMRLISNPGASIVYRYVRIGYQSGVNNGYNSSFTFTPANFNVWQNIDSPGTNGNTLGFHGSLASPQRDRFHEFVLSLSYNEFVNLVINSY